jgi:N4-gp56 family major capsid protein
VHAQFGQKQPIPKNKGKVVEFRKYDSLSKLTTPLAEGVTPDGQKMSVSTVTAEVKQYGGYVELTDMLMLTAIDNNMIQATKLIASQAGRTLDTIVREVLNAGTNVQYAEGGVSARHLLVGGQENNADNMYLTVDGIKKAVRALKVQNTEKIGSEYVAIIHPDCTYDLTSDPDWKYPHQYQDTTELYSGEIGKIAGVRFVETTEAKVWHAEDLIKGFRNLTVSSADGANVSVKETMTAEDKANIVGRKVIIGGELATVKEVSGNAIVLDAALTTAPKANDVVYPGEAGANGRDIYSTLIIGDNAYGVTDIQGGGLEHIVKQLGSSGVADALNQRASVGWKATLAAIILVNQYMVRLETASTFESGLN